MYYVFVSDTNFHSSCECMYAEIFPLESATYSLRVESSRAVTLCTGKPSFNIASSRCRRQLAASLYASIFFSYISDTLMITWVSLYTNRKNSKSVGRATKSNKTKLLFAMHWSRPRSIPKSLNMSILSKISKYILRAQTNCNSFGIFGICKKTDDAYPLITNINWVDEVGELGSVYPINGTSWRRNATIRLQLYWIGRLYQIWFATEGFLRSLNQYEHETAGIPVVLLYIPNAQLFACRKNVPDCITNHWCILWWSRISITKLTSLDYVSEIFNSEAEKLPLLCEQARSWCSYVHAPAAPLPAVKSNDGFETGHQNWIWKANRPQNLPDELMHKFSNGEWTFLIDMPKWTPSRLF